MIEGSKEGPNTTIRNVSQTNATLADALRTSSLDDYIVAYGEEPPIPVNGTPLCYVTIGHQPDEDPLATIVQTATRGWHVTRESPGMGTLLLGVYESAYGAVGLARQLHPETDVMTGGHPTYPIESIEQLDEELAIAITDTGLLNDVVDVGPATDTIAFGDGHPVDSVLVSRTEDGWRVGIESIHGHETIGSYTDSADVVAIVDEHLPDENR